MNLIRYYSAPIDRVFNAFVNGNDASTETIALDVIETPTAYVVKANVPGVAKDLIDVNVEDREVTINVEFKNDEELADAKSLWKERSFGKVSRRIVLPEAVDTSAAQARHADGVLNLTFPKIAKPSGKITIQ